MNSILFHTNMLLEPCTRTIVNILLFYTDIEPISFSCRLNLALGPHDTAMTAIDGMLRNQELIFSPPVMWFSSRIPG